MSGLGYPDVRPVLAKLADLERELVLVGGQAVNFWVSVYEGRVPALAREGPFASKDIDFCGDARSVRRCARRLNGTARLAGFDDATPNSGTVVFVDGAGGRQTLDIISAVVAGLSPLRSDEHPAVMSDARRHRQGGR